MSERYRVIYSSYASLVGFPRTLLNPTSVRFGVTWNSGKEYLKEGACPATGIRAKGIRPYFPGSHQAGRLLFSGAKEEIQTGGARVRPALSSQGVMAAACKEFSDTDLRDLVTYCIDEFGLEEAKGELPGWMSKKSSTPVLDQAPN